MRTYRIHGDPRGARDFAEWLEMGSARVIIVEGDPWTDVRTDASDELVHEAMIMTSWDPNKDGPVMEVLEP